MVTSLSRSFVVRVVVLFLFYPRLISPPFHAEMTRRALNRIEWRAQRGSKLTLPRLYPRSTAGQVTSEVQLTRPSDTSQYRWFERRVSRMQFGSLIAAEYRVNGNGPLSEDHTSCTGNELTSRWTALHSSSSDGKPREDRTGWTEAETRSEEKGGFSG